MRLRNIPRAQEEIDANPIAVKEEKKYRGNWNTVFENEQPIHIEIGMGKGQFILDRSGYRNAWFTQEVPGHMVIFRCTCLNRPPS